MVRHHSSIAVHCMLLLGIVSLHFVSAKTLSAGSQCGGTVNGTCEDGLVCVPEIPGSVINVCRDSGNSTCETERCPSLSCDPNLQYTPEGECCPLCLPPPTAVLVTTLGCTDENVHYNEGETWRRSACITCTCEEGLPLCSYEQCLAPECDNPVTVPDQCCPTCPLVEPSVVDVPEKITCQYKGETYNNGDRWNRNDDPCITCSCEDGEVLCASQSCSVDCENSVQLPNTCCPICPEDGTETSTQQPVPLATSLPPPPPPVVIITAPVLSQCEHDGQTHEDGTSWNPNGDPCTNCSCSQGLTLCFAKSCLAKCVEPVHLPGICCPVCPGEEGYPTSMSTTIPPSHTSHPTPSSSHPPSTTTHSPSPSPRPDDVTSPTTTSTTPQSPSDKPTPCKNVPCTMETVTISVVLELDYSQYLKEEELVTTQLKDALKELGLEVATIKSAEFGHKQTHVVMSVYSSEDKIPGEEELKTTFEQLQFPPVSSVKIGQHEESKSITEISNTNAKQSTQKHSQGPGKTTIIIAVTASIAIAVCSAIIIAVVITQTRRKLDLSKTVTV